MKNTSVKTLGLSKAYDNKIILQDVSLELPTNGIFGILGKNGAGKTTLLAMLMGLITPTKGEIFIYGNSLRDHKYEILKFINFQSPYVELPKKMTVFQNLVFYARLYNVNNFKSKILKLSQDLKISDLLKFSYGNLSSGQKTRVNLCKALLNNPKLLLLDEPTASLDVLTSAFIREYILDFQKKNKSTIIITSHDLVEIEKMCNYLILLDRGKLAYKGNLKNLIKNNNSLLEFFLQND